MINNSLKKIVQFKLKWLAKIYLAENKPYVIVISGTTGRIWLKDKIIEALKERSFSFGANKKNFNAEIGLPLSILGLPGAEKDFEKWIKILWKGLKSVIPSKKKKSPDYLILEMAIDHPDDMDYLLSIVRPNAVILNGITAIYRENFESLDEIAAEYGKLIKALPWNGLAILNTDDQRVKNLANNFAGKVISYGCEDGADFKAFDIQKIFDGQQFKIEVQKKEREIFTKKINRFGKHHIYAELVKEVIKDNFKEQQKEFFGKILDMSTD